MSITTIMALLSTLALPPAGSDGTYELCALAYAVHLNQVAELPLEYGVLAFYAADEQGIDPYDLAAYVASENSWRYNDLSLVASFDRPRAEIDYEPEQEGSAGEMGIAQIAPSWLRKARRDCEAEAWAAAECDSFVEQRAFEPRVNLRLAAYVVRQAHESHAEHAIGWAEVRKCKREWRKFERGERAHVPGCQLFDHGWGAHLKLGRQDRDTMCGQPGYQKRKLRKVRASITSLVAPADVWEETREEWERACGGEA